MAAKLRRPRSSSSVSRSTTFRFATSSAIAAYLTRLPGASLMRCSRSESATPRSSRSSEGGCSLHVSMPSSCMLALSTSKCIAARRICTPSRSTGSPSTSNTRSSIEMRPESSMYMPRAKRVAQRSAISSSECPSSSARFARLSSHASTLASRDGCARSKARRALRARYTSRLDTLAHFVASAALPKQQRSSTTNPSAVTAQLRWSSRTCRPNCL